MNHSTESAVPRCHHQRTLLTLALMLAAIASGCGRAPATQPAEAQSTPVAVPQPDSSALAATALLRCDELAADPHDPDRYGPGVAEDRFAPGAAIEACTQAVNLNPGHARATFQLGRAYWIAHKDDQAFDWLFSAAKANYAPAAKFIGDAYLEGRGLPQGEEADTKTAIDWYDRAQATGYPLAAQAKAEAMAELAKATLDPAKFQYASGIATLHSGEFAQADSPVYLAAYTASLVETLDSEPVLFLAPECRPLLTKIGGIVIDAIQYAAYLTALKSPEDAAKVIVSYLLKDFAVDQGRRDAITLMHEYGCKSPVAQRVIANIMVASKAR